VSTNPITSPRTHDTFTLDGVVCPGLTTITAGGAREQEWQEGQTPGETTANVNFRIEKIARVTYTVEVWKVAGFDAWTTFIAMLNAGKARRPPRVYTINDPRLAHNAIKLVAYASCGPQKLGSPGKWSYELSFVEKPPRKKIGGAIKAPANAVEAKIKEISDDNKALAGQLATMQAAQKAGK
jgi:hypothetical protein